MLSILIIDGEIFDHYSKYEYFLDRFEAEGDVAVCVWNKGAGENDIAVGNAIGSSIFNILLILGVSSTIAPIGFEFNTIVDAAIMLLSALMIFIFAFKSSKINKLQGGVLIVVYVVYLAFIILRNIYPAVFNF